MKFVYEVFRRSKLSRNTNECCKRPFTFSLFLGSYSSSGWSNRLGTVLTPVSTNVYTADRPFLWNSIDVGCRMTVIYLPSTNELFVHSPVMIDDRLKAILPTLGGGTAAAEVRHIVSPNYEHVKFAKYWNQQYPDANMWACPGLSSREASTNWTGEITEGIRPWRFETSTATPNLPSGFWDVKEIQPLHLNFEVNPFTGRPFFNEVIFYHTPSKTLLVTDFFWNYPRPDGIPNSIYQSVIKPGQDGVDDQDYGEWELAPRTDVSWKSLMWKLGMDQIFRPFYLNFMISGDEKREEYKKVVNFILTEWDIETLIPAHGDVVRGKSLIRQILQSHLAAV